MKNKKENIITVLIFGLFISAMFLSYIALPKSEFSELEKRYLKEFPEISTQTVVDGSFGNEIETYMADHMPFRSFFVGLNSYLDLITVRTATSDIYVTKDFTLVEAPAKFNQTNIDKSMKAINNFSEKTNIPVNLMIVPSAGWSSNDNILGPSQKYHDSEYINSIYSMASDKIKTIDVVDEFNNPNLYYKTDHHWNSLGAYTGYETYMKSINKPYRDKKDFSIKKVDGFSGSTYSRSALWLTPSEELELWSGSQNIVVTNGENDVEHTGVFYTERLSEADKYTVYLDGNHSVVRLHNHDAKTNDTLLVVRDSYSNCLGGFLSESFENVILVDLRYYKKSVSELCTAESVDYVLICYSLHNFLSDANIVWLR